MPAFGKSARRNPFADTLTASKPSIRENLSDAVGNLLGGSYQARVFGRNLFGAAGATIPQWTAPVNVVPQLWPVGIPLALDEAGQQFGNGNIFSGAANTAMALIPGSAVVRGGKGLVGAAGKKAVQKGAKAVEEAAQGFTAYHGSPHTFDQFDASKIGTGEGAQVYGHGLYFAQEEKVAQAYRDALKWKGTNWHDPEYVASFWTQSRGGPEKAREWLQATVNSIEKNPKNHPDQAANQAVRDAIALLDNGYDGAKQSANPGSMYQVRINADPNHFLDWDKPLSEQSPQVQKAWRKIVGEHGAAMNDGFPYPSIKQNPNFKDPYGSTMYRQTPGSASGAAEALQQAGIPGIKYLDQGSRAAGEGSRNFVVFDPRIIDIMKRYGVAAPVAASILAQQLRQPQQTQQRK